MSPLWNAIKARLTAGARQSEPPSVLTGKETEAELRGMALQLCRQCPIGDLHRHCPFHTLNGLPHESVKGIIEQMTRESLLEMFEEERICRKQHADRCFQYLGGSNTGKSSKP
jgi:hypothetical protein